MQEILSVTYTPKAPLLSELLTALEQAAIAHSIDLNIDFHRMLEDFGCLWMLVRCRLELKRMPKGPITVKTWLRTPSPVLSIRDFSIYEGDDEIGTAMQGWVVANAKERKIINLKKIPPLWELPTPQPERTDVLRRIPMPENMIVSTLWTVLPEEIDSNGHLNNVAYVRHAEQLAQTDAQKLEIIYDRECFAGETLTLEYQHSGAYDYIRGRKADGSESFRACFQKEDTE